MPTASLHGAMSSEALVRVRDLRLHFPVYSGFLRHRTGVIKAIDGISFDIFAGETLGLVGESGSGKTTAGRALLRLYSATSGKIHFDGHDITVLSGEKLRLLRPQMQMIFQDPQASLNPRMTVGSIITEPLNEHGSLNQAQKIERATQLMQSVGLNRAYMNRYPHEFSGGQRQRIGIARALALRPKFIVCDEPIAALDVSIQAQVVNLLMDLQAQTGLTYLFISHDLSMVRYLANRIAVMYLGRLVELATSADLYRRPQHPYTRALLSAVLQPYPTTETQRNRVLLTGEMPSPANPPSGCTFRTRCPLAIERCRQIAPQWRQIQANHYTACHRVELSGA